MLIFDKRRPASREQPDTSPPEGGDCPTFAHPSVGCALRLRRPARRLGRLHGGGACRPPAPLGCAPCGLPATGPCCLPTSGEGQAQRAGPQARRVSGLRGKFQKGPAGPRSGEGSGGACPPQVVERWATGLSRWAVRGQRAALSPPSTGDPGCPRRNGPQGRGFEDS